MVLIFFCSFCSFCLSFEFFSKVNWFFFVVHFCSSLFVFAHLFISPDLCILEETRLVSFCLKVNKLTNFTFRRLINVVILEKINHRIRLPGCPLKLLPLKKPSLTCWNLYCDECHVVSDCQDYHGLRRNIIHWQFTKSHIICATHSHTWLSLPHCYVTFDLSQEKKSSFWTFF